MGLTEAENAVIITVNRGVLHTGQYFSSHRMLNYIMSVLNDLIEYSSGGHSLSRHSQTKSLARKNLEGAGKTVN